MKPSSEIEMVNIPGNSYETLDYVTKRFRNTVSVSEFLIGKTPITQRQYIEIIGTNPSHHQGEERPVENVSWWDAITYCNARSEREGLSPCYNLSTGECNFSKNGYRLPTSTEWSVACAGVDRATDSKNANIGLADTRDSRELLKLVEKKGTVRVGNYPPNKFGLLDLLGNVWEWCFDYYWDNYDEALPGSDRYDIVMPCLIDPTGPLWGHLRVIRGGSFVTTPYIYALHKGYRGFRPDRKSMFTGFRVARSTERKGKIEKTVYNADWFKPYNTIPAGFEGRGNLPSLLTDADGNAITSSEQWEKKRYQLKDKWIKRLGIPLKPQHEPTVTVVKTFEEEIYTGKLIFLDWDTYVGVKIFLMVPKKPLVTPTPAVIVPWYDIDVPAGKNLGGHNAEDSSKLKSFGYLMVQQGYIAVSLQFWLLTEESYEESMAKMKLRFPQTLGLGRTVWDIHRVVDYLYTLPEVDHKKIGLIGHCAGGIMAIYCAAFEERITTTVACGSNCSIATMDTNYYDYWYLGEEIVQTIGRSTDQQELLAIIAPRPFLIALGKGNTIDVCFPFVNTAREVYSLCGKAEYLGYIYDRDEPTPSAKNVPLMRAWLMRFLGG